MIHKNIWSKLECDLTRKICKCIKIQSLVLNNVHIKMLFRNFNFGSIWTKVAEVAENISRRTQYNRSQHLSSSCSGWLVLGPRHLATPLANYSAKLFPFKGSISKNNRQLGIIFINEIFQKPLNLKFISFHFVCKIAATLSGMPPTPLILILLLPLVFPFLLKSIIFEI